MSDTLPPLPEPHGWIYDGIPNMLLFNRGPLPQTTALVCSTAPVYSADQMHAYAAAALAAAEPVASVTECEACFTPDVCQLRGTCDHYAAERLRVAAPPQREPDVPETRFGDMPERLRTYSADTELSERYSDAMQEAADEIEQLREQNTMLDATLAQLEAATVAEPLTKTEFARLWREHMGSQRFPDEAWIGKELAERAHGIAPASAPKEQA